MNESVKKALFWVTVVGGTVGASELLNQFLCRRARKYPAHDKEPLRYKWRFGQIAYTKYAPNTKHAETDHAHARSGSDTPVVLIHAPEAGASRILMEPLAEKLSSEHTVYLLDLPGYGQSDKPHMTYTAYFFVNMLSDFMENVVKQPACVIADGLSCLFVALACNTRPDAYTQLIFFNPPTPEACDEVPGAFAKYFLKPVLELPIIGTLVYNLTLTQSAYRKKYGSMTDTVMTHRMNAAAHEHMQGARFAFASCKTNFMNANISRPIARLDRSVYVMLSGDEERCSIEAEVLYDLNQSIETEYIPSGRTCPWLQNPKAVEDTLKFLL